MTSVVEAVPVDLARQRDVAAALREFLPEPSVLFEREDVQPYECDGLSAYRQVPMVVALPENEEQVRRIVRTCFEMRVPVVARGAGTGLSGGALPLGNGVLLSLAKLMRILEIDRDARTARVQPGVRNLAISEAAAPTAFTTRPIRRARSRAASAATSPRIRAACTVSSTVSRSTTFSRSAR